MIKVYCDGCEALIQEIETFCWRGGSTKVPLAPAYKFFRDTWCQTCGQARDDIIREMKARKESLVCQIERDTRESFKNAMGKTGSCNEALDGGPSDA